MPMSKTKQFIRDFLCEAGKSGFIRRHTLPSFCAYTSGDGIFRSDSQIGRKYKFCRFSPKFNPDRKTSRCWDLDDSDRKMLLEEHATLKFPQKGEEGYKGAGKTVYYIKFYGKGVPRRTATIRGDIKKEICKLPCVSCGTTTGIECDHKNDLVLEQNDERVLNTKTQTLADFQPLCKHCNDVKRASKARMMNSGNRQGAPGFPSQLAFTEGDEKLDDKDFYWYRGTYWGDVAEFKREISRRIFGGNIVQEAVKEVKEEAEKVEYTEEEQEADAIQWSIQTNNEEFAHSLASYSLDNKPSNK